MTKSNTEIQLNCFLIEAMVKELVVKGTTNNEELVAAVSDQFNPKNDWEREVYSEAILFAKYSILN